MRHLHLVDIEHFGIGHNIGFKQSISALKGLIIAHYGM